jgi:hypothetical protein
VPGKHALATCPPSASRLGCRRYMSRAQPRIARLAPLTPHFEAFTLSRFQRTRGPHECHGRSIK